VLLGEALELGQPCHVGLLLVDDLAQDAGRVEPGHAGEVDGRLGVARPLQDAPLPVAEGEDVAGTGEVPWLRGRVDERLHGGGAVEGRDAGGRAVAVVDRDGEGGPVALGVLVDHERQVELVAALAGDRGADQAGGVLQEEGDLVRRDVLGRHDEVALVLAVLVVDDDDDLAAADGGDGVLDLGEPARPVARRSPDDLGGGGRRRVVAGPARGGRRGASLRTSP
jgi:hypothetical protein